jgi:hypothetical protein
MSLEQVFHLSQSIASIAVVGSLIYLGLLVRGADRSQRAVMQRGRADLASNAALTVANGELARVWQRGMDAGPTVTREEVTQWLLLCRSMFPFCACRPKGAAHPALIVGGTPTFNLASRSPNCGLCRAAREPFCSPTP